MVHKRILLINTFPIANAQGGGQKREAALVAAYRRTYADVRYVGIFFKGFYKDYDATDIPLPDHLTPEVHRSPHTADMLSGKAIFDDPYVKRRMFKILTTFKPDVIEIEQVFPYMGLKPLLAELGLNPVIVYSSHNIEYSHKQELLHSVGMPTAEIKPIVEEIERAEIELVRRARLVIACTESDRKAYEKLGAQKTVLARNGMAPIKTTEAAVAQWRQHFLQEAVTKIILFVGAAHPPNWVGLRQMVGLRMGFVPFNVRIVLAGGIADHFKDALREEYNPEHATFWSRVEAVGRPSDERLGALLRVADVIMLPITEGGGSNLKTAEAVLADKPIVATAHAFRSFEALKDLPNIHIADTPDAFRAALLHALQQPQKRRTAAQQKLAQSVIWEQCLQNAVHEVSAL